MEPSASLGQVSLLPFRPQVWPPLLFAAGVYGVLIFLVLPAGVTAHNDDFGYLRSIVETLQHQRLWTNDWLEPWAGGLSFLSALLFTATDSFFVATNGLLAILAAASFWAGCRLLQDRGLPVARAILVTALLLTFPCVLWKSLEFTSVALYLPCLLLALHAGERRRWGWFLIVWLLALATRQSALTWAVLPAIGAMQAWSRRSVAQSAAAWMIPALVTASGFALFGMLGRVMNRTHAQILLTDSIFDHLWMHINQHIGPSRLLETFLVGAGIFLVAAGLGSNVLRWPPSPAPKRAWRRVLVGLGAVIVVQLLAPRIAVEHDSFSIFTGHFYAWSVLLLAWAGWSSGTGALSWSAVAYASGSVAALCLRGGVWDYYLLDVAVFGFFGMTARDSSMTPVAKVSDGRGRIWFRRIACGLLIASHAVFLLNFKVMLDRSHALVTLAEHALRAGKLQPSELSFAPFGYAGWHLYPYYIAHEGKTMPDLAGFLNYVGSGEVAVGQGYSRALHLLPRFRHEPPADRRTLIGHVAFRCCWFFRGEFFLLRLSVEEKRPPVWKLVERDYRFQPFPLNDAEWHDLVRPESIR